MSPVCFVYFAYCTHDEYYDIICGQSKSNGRDECLARTKTSSAVKDRYNAKAYDEIKVRVPKGRKDEIQAQATANGESLNGFVTTAIDERIERGRAVAGDLKGESEHASL